jgi:hypothetical protein
MTVPEPVPDALRMRASDADREVVAGLLRDAYAEGRLSPVEHEERLTGVYSATTYADLVPLLADLPLPPGAIAVPGIRGAVALSGRTTVPATSSGGLVDVSRADHAQGPAIAIFSGVERKGGWVVPESMSIVAVMGGVDLDLTDAVLTAQDTTFHVVTIMGGVQLRVPDGVAVRMEAFGFMGGTSTPAGDPPPGAPVLRITGVAFMGGIDVKRSKRARIAGGDAPQALGSS